MDSQRFVEAVCGLLRESSPEESHYSALRHAIFESVVQFEISDRMNLKHIHQILRKNPTLITSGTGYILSASDPIIDELAARMNVDADADPRPMIMVGALFVAFMSAMRVWVKSKNLGALPDIANKALNTFDQWGEEVGATRIYGIGAAAKR